MCRRKGRKREKKTHEMKQKNMRSGEGGDKQTAASTNASSRWQFGLDDHEIQTLPRILTLRSRFLLWQGYVYKVKLSLFDRFIFLQLKFSCRQKVSFRSKFLVLTGFIFKIKLSAFVMGLYFELKMYRLCWDYIFKVRMCLTEFIFKIKMTF